MGNLPPLKNQVMEVEMAEITGSKFKAVMGENLQFEIVNFSD